MSKETIYTIPENAPKEGEVYEHYKGDLYRVLYLTAHNDPDELCVIYEAMYDNPAFPKYSRLLRSWLEEIEWQGEKVKRFGRTNLENKI